MDGFGTGLRVHVRYTIFDEEQIPNYWHWAREYSLSENFFSSAGGPSYPTTTSSPAPPGVSDNPENIRSLKEDGRTFKSWGCARTGRTSSCS